MSTAHMGSNGGCPRCGWLVGHFAGCTAEPQPKERRVSTTQTTGTVTVRTVPTPTRNAPADTNDTLAVTARERDLTVTEPDGGFWVEGRECAAEVATWPAWKREAAARARVTEPSRRVWCRACGAHRDIDAQSCLQGGWPKHCGSTMTIDSPEEQAAFEKGATK